MCLLICDGLVGLKSIIQVHFITKPLVDIRLERKDNRFLAVVVALFQGRRPASYVVVGV
jgi:hypothetical protein